MLTTIFLLVLVYIGDFVKSSDPCQAHEVLTENSRAANIKIDLASVNAFSDDRLKLRWYKIENDVGEEMAFEPPGIFMCTTWFPIWLNGTLPPDVNQTLIQQACLQTFEGICERSWNIRIKRCPENYYVYELSPSPITDSGYCFGWANECPDGESSETGKEPGCSSEFPHILLEPFVESLLVEGSTINDDLGPSLLPTFRCMMTNISKTHVYDVYWVINDFSVLTFKNKVESELLSTDLMPHHWIQLHKMNMKVKCSVRVRTAIGATPSPKHQSQELLAGLIIEQKNYQNLQIAEGEEKIIKLKATVPIGCTGKKVQSHCKNMIYMNQPNGAENRCFNNIQEGNIAFERQSCGISIHSVGWNATFDLRITGYVDSLYNLNTSRTATVRLITMPNEDPSGVWNNVIIPDLKIKVTDSDLVLAGRIGLVLGEASFVSIYNQHFSFQAVGEFILYKHNHSKYEIHVLKTASLTGTGICGIAIRSFNSLFVIRTCSTLSQVYIPPDTSFVPVIKYTKCEDKDMIVQQYPGRYSVMLPSGTEVTFRFTRYWISHILLKPSVLDEGKVNGLLGKNSEHSQYNFIKINRISYNSKGNLFSENPSFHENTFSVLSYCECKREDSKIHYFSSKFNDSQCNFTEPSKMMLCNPEANKLDDVVYGGCKESRKRRDVDNTNTISSNIVKPLIYDKSINSSSIIQHYDWPTNWTQERAEQFCKEAILGNPTYKICIKYTQLDTSVLIAVCINDLKVVGGHYKWSDDVLRDICFIESVRNETLYTTKTNSNEVLYDFVVNKLCPDDCSGNGVCIKGNCLCSENFIGDTCASKRSDAPMNITVPTHGLCSTRQQDCQGTYVFGDFKSKEVYCKLSQIQILPDEVRSDESVNMYPAIYNSKYKIFCPFSSQRRKRTIEELAHGYELWLSYDKINFGDKLYIIIYDEDCVSCDIDNLQCAILSRCRKTTTAKEITTRASVSTEDASIKHFVSDKQKDDAIIPVLLTIICTLCVCLLSGIAWTCYKIKANLKGRRQTVYVADDEKSGIQNVVYSVFQYDYGCDRSPPYSKT